MFDPLYSAVAAGDQDGVVRALRGRTEGERRAAAPAIVRAARADRWNTMLAPDGELVEGRSGDRHTRALRAALLGTATVSEMRRCGELVDYFHEEHFELLADRDPPWLTDFADWQLPSSFPLIRRLIRAGRLARPTSRAYLDGLLINGPSWLDDEPELREHEMWELIRFDGETYSLRTEDRSGGWARAITSVAPRERLLDTLLDALAGDLTGYRATWHIQLWSELEPTPEERASRTAALIAVLGASAPPAVRFGVTELLRNGAAVPAAQLTPALAAAQKSTVKAALKLLDRDPDPGAAAVALGHEAADVQGAALTRLERWGLDDAARDALLRDLDGLAATQRPRAEALLGVELPAPEHRAPELDVSAIPEAIRVALNFGGPVPAAPVPGEPVLGEPAPAPIASLEELADVLNGALVDDYWHCDDERLLDGILRFCGSRDAFDGPLKPLVKKLRKIDWNSRFAVPPVATAWLTGEELRLGSTEPDEPPHLWELRIADATRRAARGQPTPLLALPTHANGWLEPRVLVERLRGTEPDDAELAEAILRLAPRGRDEALAYAHSGLAADAARLVYTRQLPVEFVAVAGHPWRTIELQFPGLPDVPLAKGIAEDANIRWKGTIRHYLERLGWPAQRQIACASAIAYIGANVSYLLALLLAPSEPLPPLALRLATLALGSGDERNHLAAADLLIAAIADGRADAPALAPGLDEDLSAERLMPSRLGPRLMTVAAAGPLHRAVVRDLLDRTVPALAARPPRTHAALLEPFDELCAQTNTRVHHARAFLETLTGSSQATQAARRLLARTGEPPDSERELALQARIARAQRWIG